jgi:hypothetical protein
VLVVFSLRPNFSQMAYVSRNQPPRTGLAEALQKLGTAGARTAKRVGIVRRGDSYSKCVVKLETERIQHLPWIAAKKKNH